MTRILFKFIIYPNCERALKIGRVKSKKVKKSSFGDIFWLYMIVYDYFSSVFCIVPKKVLLLKFQKWVNHLKNRYHYVKVVLSAVLCKRQGFTLDIYLLFENGHKNNETRCKVCSNLTKCTTTIDFRLTSVFFINIEHLLHLILVLLFII